MSTIIPAIVPDIRGPTHGDFDITARIAQRLKEVVRNELRLRSDRGRPALGWNQQEALEMICAKMARIISGDPDFADHWKDIIGYSMLGNG